MVNASKQSQNAKITIKIKIVSHVKVLLFLKWVPVFLLSTINLFLIAKYQHNMDVDNVKMVLKLIIKEDVNLVFQDV